VTRLRATVLLALVAWSVGRAGIAAAALGRELRACNWTALAAGLGAGEEERLEATLAALDQTDGLPRGYHLELFRALERSVPSDAEIRVVQRPGSRAMRKLNELNILIVPRVYRVAASTDP